MKTRKEAEEYYKSQFVFNVGTGRIKAAPEDARYAERLEKLKRGAFHYGRVELKELMDFIYGCKNDSVEEE